MKEKNNIEWVDVHNDALMVSLGIRPRNVQPRDPSVWTKTDKEKKILKKLRNRYKPKFKSSSIAPKKHIPVYAKLIVQVNSKAFPKTTYSHMCWQSDIQQILNNYVDKDGRPAYTKYHWNGQDYKPGTLPFWYVKGKHFGGI